MLKAYIFALPKSGNNLHSHLFNTLKARGIETFVKQKLIFFANSNFIICRSAVQVPKIQMKEEVLDVKSGSKIKGIFSTSNCVSKLHPKEVREKLIAKKDGRPLKYGESHRNVNLEGDELNEHLIGLLQKSGLKDIQIESTYPLYNDSLYVNKAQRSFSCLDVKFSATIDDLDTFSQAWFNGIGRLKTYGFGMLRVVPV